MPCTGFRQGLLFAAGSRNPRQRLARAQPITTVLMIRACRAWHLQHDAQRESLKEIATSRLRGRMLVTHVAKYGDTTGIA